MTEESGRVNWQANVVVRADREAVEERVARLVQPGHQVTHRSTSAV